MSTVADAPAPARGPLLVPGGLPPAAVAGCLWFLALALLYGQALPSLVRDLSGPRVPFAAWATVVSRGCTVTFLLTQAWLMMARPPAVAQTRGLGALAIALAGTYGVWLVGFLPPAALSPALAVAAAAMTLVGSALIVFNVLHLGRSFSIVPQARTLVTRGPYAIVRHPLYAAEEIALIGVALHVVWYAALPFVVLHVALQLKRMAYEERLLRDVFPQYDAYARRTSRWIPGIW
jgi:protein-S-isoprenylcysteine O-methyltransferase Ste14